MCIHLTETQTIQLLQLKQEIRAVVMTSFIKNDCGMPKIITDSVAG